MRRQRRQDEEGAAAFGTFGNIENFLKGNKWKRHSIVTVDYLYFLPNCHDACFLYTAPSPLFYHLLSYPHAHSLVYIYINNAYARTHTRARACIYIYIYSVWRFLLIFGAHKLSPLFRLYLFRQLSPTLVWPARNVGKRAARRRAAGTGVGTRESRRQLCAAAITRRHCRSNL